MNIENNIPAFSQHPDVVPVNNNFHCGMTLLDYFAAKAMQGLVTAYLASDLDWNYEEVARCAHEQADAMLEARKKYIN